MAHIITRRGAIGLGAGALAAAAGDAAAQRIQAANAEMPRLPIESGAALRVIRPTRFVEPDEVIFRENTAKFAQATGVQVRVDFVGWEDIRAQTAVTANTAAGPDVVIGWADDPHVYADKLVEVSDIAEYLGKKYGGWMFLGEKYGKRARSNNWIGIPLGGSTGPVVYRVSAVKEAGFDTIPQDHAGFLRLCQALKRLNKPAGFTLGNAVGDGNGTANWLTWSHGGYLVDEDGKVAINSRETIESLSYLKELYPTFAPGTAILARPVQQPRLRLAGVLADAERRFALLRHEERPGDARHRRRHRPRAAAARPRAGHPAVGHRS
jgi:multiple sugar transport system substrate-binding protein